MFLTVSLAMAAAWDAAANSSPPDSLFRSVAEIFKTDYDRAMKLAGEAAEKAESDGALSAAGEFHKMMGVNAYYKGDYERSLRHYHKALDHFEKAGDRRGEAFTLNELGNYTKKHGTLDQAIVHLEKAMGIFEELKDASGIANACNNLGVVYEMKQDTSRALKLYTRSLQLYASLPDSVGMSYSIDNMAGIYLIRKMHDKALGLLNRSVVIRERIHDDRALAITLNNMGELFLDMKQPREAIPYMKRSLSLSARTGFSDLRKHTMNLVSEAYAALGDHSLAFEWQRAYSQLKDSLYSATMHRQITELSTKYEAEKKEKENAQLRQETQAKELELSRKQNWILILVFSVLLLGGLALLSIYRIRARQKEQLASEREEQQQARLRAVIETQETERRRIAEDLHDGIGQMLAGIRINLGHMTEAMSAEWPAKKEEFARSVQTLDEACSELRSLSHQMMPKALSRHGLTEALQDLFEHTFSGTPVRSSFQHHGNPPVLPDLTSIHIFRIVQELLGNILKHAGASEVNAQLLYRNDSLAVVIEDDGVEFDFQEASRTSRGMGLSNILSRVQTLQGTISFGRGSGGKGTLVNLRVPIHGRS